MKTRTLLLTTLCAIASLAYAEDTKPGNAGSGAGNGGRGANLTPEQRAQKLKETVNLTDEQTAKVKEIYEKNMTPFKELREDKTLSEDEKKTKMRDLYQGVMKEVSAVLTPEQQQKWKDEAQKRRAQQGAK